MNIASDFVLVVVAGLLGGLLARLLRLPLLVGYVAAANNSEWDSKLYAAVLAGFAGFNMMCTAFSGESSVMMFKMMIHVPELLVMLPLSLLHAWIVHD